VNQSIPVELFAKGYRVKGTDICIDPLEPVRCAIITHAHGDHAVEGHETVYCSPGTAALIKERYRFPAKTIKAIPFGETFNVSGISFSLHPAGHILGSSQIRWQAEGKTIVFTGDFKREADPSCEPFEMVTCDVLITEVTFGQKGKTHPPAEAIVAELERYKGLNLIIGAYNLGKSQRLTRLISDHAPTFRIMIHPYMVGYHKVYEQFGFKLGKWEPYKREVFKHQRNIIYLVSPHAIKNLKADKHVLKAIATGWDEKAANYNFPLPVSDHADWPALLATIHESGAKEIYTMHGDGQMIAGELRDEHLKIYHLGE